MNCVPVTRLTVLAGSALMLAACFGGEPSASNIQQAAKESGLLHNDMRGRLPFNVARSSSALEQAIEVAKIEKSGCARAQGQPGYMCDFKIGIPEGGGFKYGPSLTARFFKTDSGWQMAAR